MDTAQIIQKVIHFVVFISSAMTAININGALIIKNTYQKLQGFCLVMKKQQTASMTPKMAKINSSPLSLSTNRSGKTINTTINKNMTINAKAQPGTPDKNDFCPLVFMIN